MTQLNSVEEVFSRRHSVRTFREHFPENKKEIVNRIIEEVNQIPTPFQTTDSKISLHSPGLGSLGFVSKEAGWLLLQVSENSMNYTQSLMDAAYRGQIAVMKLTENEIGTVWIGGTFSKSQAELDSPGYKVDCVIAFGIEDQPRFLEKTIKFFGGSSSRKVLSEISYDLINKSPFIEENNNNKFIKLLKCLRSGPSAINQQPWRFLIDEKKIYIFNSSNNNYSICDMGISLANISYFYNTYKENNKFLIENEIPESLIGGTYLCTYNL